VCPYHGSTRRTRSILAPAHRTFVQIQLPTLVMLFSPIYCALSHWWLLLCERWGLRIARDHRKTRPFLSCDDSGPRGTPCRMVCPFVASIPVFCTYYLLPLKSYKFVPFCCRHSKSLSRPNALSDSTLILVLQVWLSGHAGYNPVFYREILSPSELRLPYQHCSFSLYSLHPFRQVCLVRPNGSRRRPQLQPYLSHSG